MSQEHCPFRYVSVGRIKGLFSGQDIKETLTSLFLFTLKKHFTVAFAQKSFTEKIVLSRFGNYYLINIVRAPVLAIHEVKVYRQHQKRHLQEKGIGGLQ
jgi:hypothetical protein